VSGYCACACRDCMEIAIGEPGDALCHECVAAGCWDEPSWPDNECQAPHAYGGRCADPACCGEGETE
jgi:hypothetical protein